MRTASAPSTPVSPAPCGAVAAGRCPAPLPAEVPGRDGGRGVWVLGGAGIPRPGTGEQRRRLRPSRALGEGSADTARCPSAPLRRPAPGAQVSDGVGCSRCHGRGCEGHPGGRAGGRGLRGGRAAVGGLGEPRGHGPGRERVPPRRRFAAIAGTRGLGQPGLAEPARVRAGLRARPQRVPGIALRPFPQPRCFPWSALRGIYSLAAAVPSLPTSCPRPDRGRWDAGGRRGLLPPEPQQPPVSRRVL